MRLINTTTLEPEEFIVDPPPYAILSHTWENGEVLYDDFAKGTESSKQGYAKVKGCCELAASEGLKYAWIDTCCIDKTSSAELSEAINSMFNWYQNSDVCYVYLNLEIAGEYISAEELKAARWTSRG
ncbi:heterokaryon incompatibility protein-domain-containing protein [Clohesyomyces aquaticus]|uniref:Heterokaryon incompatibility protein-domain-containing protein n=1 Tax=Clohesyomyces aquaticus TaxID=1231657 RepID=A0A1Y1ZSY1_9PLEO|nr:heterokaryon incompatibility protein-domain-containing protein [Clohesyomyces aquaticus]